MYQLFRSLAYIHSLGICHRDIKPQNLLLDPETAVLKLCDFGSAKQLLQGEPNVSYICSRYYRAPELIFGAINYTTRIGKCPNTIEMWNFPNWLEFEANWLTFRLFSFWQMSGVLDVCWPNYCWASQYSRAIRASISSLKSSKCWAHQHANKSAKWIQTIPNLNFRKSKVIRGRRYVSLYLVSQIDIVWPHFTFVWCLIFSEFDHFGPPYRWPKRFLHTTPTNTNPHPHHKKQFLIDWP